MREGILFAGGLMMVLRPVFAVEASDDTQLRKHVADMGRHHPGVDLFNTLFEDQMYVPFFSVGRAILFLGSKAVRTPPQLETAEQEVLPVVGESQTATNVFQRACQLLVKLFGGGNDKENKKVIPHRTERTASLMQIGYLALRRDKDGSVFRDFVAEEDLVHLIRSEDIHHFVLEAGEPE